MFADPKAESSSLPALRIEWLKRYLPQYLRREQETPEEILDIKIVQVWWDDKRTTILYELAFRETGGAERKHLYVGYLVAPERLAEEFKSVSKRARFQPAAGRSVALIAEAQLVLAAFPNDRKLRLFSDAELQRWLKAKWHAYRRSLPKHVRTRKWKIKSVRAEVLRYVPDKRFTMRCRVRLARKDGSSKEISVIAKQLTDGKKAKKSFRNLIALQAAWSNVERVTPSRLRALLKTPTPVRFPRALAWDEERAIVFMEDLPGKNLEHALPELDLAQTFHAAGEMLAVFHAAPRRVRKRASRATELKEVRAAIREISAAFPELRPRLRNLAKQLHEAPCAPATPEVLLHGTFRLNHIFIHAGALALLDLDSLRTGPAAYDLANFLSALYYFEAQGRLTQAQRAQIAGAFLRGYAEKAAAPVAPAEVLWFLASLLLNKQASKYVSHHHPDRAQKLERMLGLAEAALLPLNPLAAEVTLATLGPMLP